MTAVANRSIRDGPKAAKCLYLRLTFSGGANFILCDRDTGSNPEGDTPPCAILARLYLRLQAYATLRFRPLGG